MTLAHEFKGLFSRSQCSACRQRLVRTAVFCGACATTLDDRPPNMVVSNGLVTVQIRAATRYGAAAAIAIQRLKYGKASHLAEPLAALMNQRLPELVWNTMLTPIPLHPRRLVNRGYNQSALLARHLRGRTQALLCRTRDTTPQRDLGADARRRNCIGAFRSQRARTDQRLVLVDDVATTGATLLAAAAAWRANGGPPIVDAVVVALVA